MKNTNDTRSSNSILSLMNKIPDTGFLRRVLGEIEEEVKTTKIDSKSLNKEYLKFVKEKKKHFEDLDLKQFELSNTQVKYNSVQEDINLIKSEIERVQREDSELDVTMSRAESELDLVDSERMHLEQSCLSLKEKLQVRKAQVATIKNKIDVTNSLTKDFTNNKASFEMEVASIIETNTELEIAEEKRNKLLKAIEKETANAKLLLEKNLKDKESKEFKLKQLEKSIDEAKENLNITNEQVKKSMEENRELDSQLHTKIMELNSSKENQEELSKKKSHFTSQKNVIELSISNTIKEKNEVDLEVNKIISSNDSLILEISNKEKELSQINRIQAEILIAKNMSETKQDQLSAKYESVVHELSKADASLVELNENCKRIQSRIYETISEIQLKDKQIESIKIEIDKVNDDKSLLSLKLIKSNKQNENRSELFNELNIQLAKEIEERDKLESDRTEISKELNLKEKNLGELHKEIQSVNEDKDDLKRRITGVKELIERSEKNIFIKKDNLEISNAEKRKLELNLKSTEIEIESINNDIKLLVSEEEQNKITSMLLSKNILSVQNKKNKIIEKRILANDNLELSKAELLEKESDLLLKENEVEIAKKSKLLIENQIKSKELEISLVHKQTGELEKEIQTIEVSINHSQNELFDQNQSLLDLNKEFEVAHSLKQKALRELRSTKNENNKTQKIMNDLSASIAFVENSSVKLLNRNGVIENNICKNQELIARLEVELENLKMDNDSFENKINSKEKILESELTQQSKIKEKYNQANELHKTLINELDKVQIVLREVIEKNKSIEAKRVSLENDIKLVQNKIMATNKFKELEKQKLIIDIKDLKSLDESVKLAPKKLPEQVVMKPKIEVKKSIESHNDLLELSQLLDVTNSDKKIIIGQIQKMKKSIGNDLSLRIIELLRSELITDSIDLQNVQITCTTYGDSKYQLKTFVNCPKEDDHISINLQKAFKKSFRGKAIYLSRTLEAYQLTCQNFPREKARATV